MARFCYVCLLFCCISSSFSRKLPSYITQCKRDDPKLNECILAGIEATRPHLNEGVPEMKLPSFNPLHLDIIIFNAGNLHLELKNVSLFGLLDVQVIEVFTPKLTFRSYYSVSGNLLAITLQGSGYEEIIFSDMHYSMKIQGKREKRNGKEYLTCDMVDSQVEIASAKFRFDDLFKDNPELTSRTNQILNDNSQAILKDMKQLIGETMSSTLLSVFKGVYELYSIDELFL